MQITIIILFFIFGAIFGSFYNVVGYRLPRGESLIYPSSHCPKCNKKLTPIELVPIFSYIFLGGKCKNCHKKISLFYPIFEFFSGMLFVLSYISFGLSFECLLSILFISMLLIIIISDYQTMTIPDSVLIIFTFLILLVKFFTSGIEEIGISILNGTLSFIFMLLLRAFGNFLFKKESMGGGDIKLMFTFGVTIGFYMSLVCVFLSAVIGLPISLFIIRKSKSHEIPYGPFLAVAAIIIMLLKIDINAVISLFYIF